MINLKIIFFLLLFILKITSNFTIAYDDFDECGVLNILKTVILKSL